jgi:hypothetical protein
LKNKVFEANKKGKAAFLLGCDIGFFLYFGRSTKVPRDIVDDRYTHIEIELQVLGLNIATDLRELLKEIIGSPPNDVLNSKIKITLSYTKGSLAAIQSSLDYIFDFGFKFFAGQLILIHGSMAEGERYLQELEDCSKEIKNNKLYSDFHKEVVDKAIIILKDEINKKRSGNLNESDVQRAFKFIEDIRVSLGFFYTFIKKNR